MAADCPHHVVFAGLCADCGQAVSEPPRGNLTGSAAAAGKAARGGHAASSGRLRPGFLTASTDLRVSKGALVDIAEGERQRRLSAKRLVLVLDVDHTLLQATPKPLEGSVAAPGEDGRVFHVRLRPFLREFLRDAAKLAEMYVYTHGQASYAAAAVKAMDPEGIFFGIPPRLFTRDNTPQGLKRIEEIFPVEASQVVIFDDRDEMWHPRVRDMHLVKVSPYLFYQNDARSTISFEGHVANFQPEEGGSVAWLPRGPARPDKRMRTSLAAPAASVSMCAGGDPDEQLLFSVMILQRIHEACFGGRAGDSENVGSALPMAEVLHSLRAETLKGCRIVLTGLGAISPTHAIAWWCVQLGATVEEGLTPQSTHVVAARRDSAKYHAALAKREDGLHIVHPGWVLRAISTWERPIEAAFAVPAQGPFPPFCEVWVPDAAGDDADMLLEAMQTNAA